MLEKRNGKKKKHTKKKGEKRRTRERDGEVGGRERERGR